MNPFVDNTFIGKKIIIDFMDDKNSVPEGTAGIIQHVDDAGQIHVKWENGSTLAIVPETDKFRLA